MPSGGSVSFLYGFIFCVLCNFALGASLGEMAAVWPTAGGQYHFVYALCSEKWKKSVVSQDGAACCFVACKPFPRDTDKRPAGRAFGLAGSILSDGLL